MKQPKLSKSDKTLIAISDLSTKRKNPDKITVEDVAVNLWLTYPKEFCMRGYPQYPNVDIPKYITKLLNNNLVRGGVSNYSLTDKGQKYVQTLTKRLSVDKINIMQDTRDVSREVKSELNRILTSKIFNYFRITQNPDFLESDFFDFLGTSSRSLSNRDKNIFSSRYNLVVKDILPYCLNNKEDNENLQIIIDLWNMLEQKFENIIKTKQK